jgi:hypothetical protein
MNRIILIGNGFDLAHGLPTKYSNFIDNHWENILNKLKDLDINEVFEDEIIKLKNPSKNYDANNYHSLKEEIKKKNKENEELDNVRYGRINTQPIKIEYLNKFFDILNNNRFKNWVDIEEEYYSELIKIKNNEEQSTFNHIDELNHDFEAIKNLLIKYLKNIDEQNKNQINKTLKIQNRIGNKIYFPIIPEDLNAEGLNHIVDIVNNEIDSYKDDPKNYEERFVVDINHILKNTNVPNRNPVIKNMLLSNNAINNFNLIPDNTLILTFNYTSTHYFYDNPNQFDVYSKKIFTKVKDIKIHGSVNKNDKNPVIFGYGDELDDEYISIEKLKNNNFLENIKSIKYSETANYKKTLEFLESDLYQIFIMGHSCGTSDRTLLNTLFEHKNCTSIKIFYHDKGNDGDNFSDLVRNISRNFNDKIKMRDRLVNKSNSEPL